MCDCFSLEQPSSLVDAPGANTRVSGHAGGGGGFGGLGLTRALPPAEVRRLRKCFRQLLIRRCGTVVGAWRSVLDSGRHGRISYYEFCRGCQKLGYDGKTRTLWEALDIDRLDFVSLYEVDPPLARLFESLALSIWGSSGSVEAAWEQFFDKKFAGKVSFETFISAAGSMGFTGDAVAAFRELVPVGVSTMSREDFSYLGIFWQAQQIGGLSGVEPPSCNLPLLRPLGACSSSSPPDKLSRVGRSPEDPELAQRDMDSKHRKKDAAHAGSAPIFQGTLEFKEKQMRSSPALPVSHSNSASSSPCSPSTRALKLAHSYSLPSISRSLLAPARSVPILQLVQSEASESARALFLGGRPAAHSHHLHRKHGQGVEAGHRESSVAGHTLLF